LLTRVLLIALGAMLAVGAPEAPARPRVECLRVGQGGVDGELVSISADKLTLQRDGQPVAYDLAEFREIVFPAPQGQEARPPFTLWTIGGARMMAEKVVGAGTDSLDVTGRGWQGRGVPLAAVRALGARDWQATAPAAELEAFEQARANPPAGNDLLMVVREDARRSVPCIVDKVQADGLAVVAEGRALSVPWSQVGWLVLSPAAGRAPAGKPAHLLELADGTSLRAASLALEDGRLSAQDGPASYSIEPARLARIRVAPVAYVYLSDLEPARTEQTPFLDVSWPPRADRAVAGGPLALKGRAYAKGIGMYGGTRMTFALPDGYSKLYALAGVDDAAGKLGRVTFRVLLDGRAAFEAGPLSAGGEPAPVVVDLAGARELTLSADFGSPVDASGDFADWAEVRLVR
jgi:hypothetical protein